jgi:glycerophosphoryl diester phosphodiesterase
MSFSIVPFQKQRKPSSITFFSNRSKSMRRTIPHLLTAFATATSICSAAPLIIGHRGASFVAPENTIASIKEAWKEGADGTEVDVYLTKDGKLVTIHDKTTKRTTGVEMEVHESTFEELSKLDAGLWKDAKWKGERIATLADSLAAVPAGKIIYIELKGGQEILPELRKVIDASGKAKQEIYLIDFKLDNLIAAKSLFPDIRKLWIVGGKTDKKTKGKVFPDVKELAAQAKAAGMDGLDLNEGFPMDEAATSAIKHLGLELAVWTVNEPEMTAKWIEANVSAITTDKPEAIRKSISKAKGN